MRSAGRGRASPRTAAASATAWARHVITEEFEAAVPIDEQMGYDERLRLLYVACTRACDHLVVSLHREERKNPPAKHSSRTNAEMLLAGMGDRLDALPDVGGEPDPAARSIPAAVPAAAARLRRVGGRARRRPRRRPADPAPSPPPPSPTRAPPTGAPTRVPVPAADARPATPASTSPEPAPPRRRRRGWARTATRGRSSPRSTRACRSGRATSTCRRG